MSEKVGYPAGHGGNAKNTGKKQNQWTKGRSSQSLGNQKFMKSSLRDTLSHPVYRNTDIRTVPVRDALPVLTKYRFDPVRPLIVDTASANYF